jgi:starch synthase (maltosyl-transferring)
MVAGSGDRWSARVRLPTVGRYRYSVEAWRDDVASWSDRLRRKAAADQSIAIEVAEASVLLRQAARRAKADGRPDDARRIKAVRLGVAAASPPARIARLAGSVPFLAAAARHPDRSAASRYVRDLEVVVERRAAAFAAWYELFPRSQGTTPRVGATFDEAARRLPALAAMGFDVVYLPPIHPIGQTYRKGRNNAEIAKPSDVGSPWGIGSEAGGHEAVAPELGGLPAFLRFRRAAERQGIEVALDLAIQASPDHPWVREHPEWFRHAPDGSIRYAENPPKRYQDVYPFDFHAHDPAVRAALWKAWRDLVLLWIDRGVRIFRVDNPHTKPNAFWEWLIRDVTHRDPSVIFLAEAFTRAKPMRALAKAGFSQSYTYFTWRERRDVLRDFLTEMTRGEMRQYYRGNLFTNTPDILPRYLRHGQATFEARLVLAATLSGLYGIYSGFELLENRRIGTGEDYRNAEKYEIRVRDWTAEPNLIGLITTLNRLRRDQSALQRSDTLRFEAADGARTLFYRKALPAGGGDSLGPEPSHWEQAVWVAVNTQPTSAERAILRPDWKAVGVDPAQPYRFIDLVGGRSRLRRGKTIAMTLGPARSFAIFTIEQAPAAPRP